MATQDFKTKLGHWLWNFQLNMERKDTQFAVLDTANRMQKGEGLMIDHTKASGEILSSTLELQYILDAHHNEAVCLLGMLIGQDYTTDLDEFVETP